MHNDIDSQATVRTNHALVDLRFGRSIARFELEITPVGLIAVGVLVSSILLSVVPIVNAATRHLQKH